MKENPIRYTLLRRKNQKYVRIRINGNGTVRVSAPESMSLGRIQEAVEARRIWIRRHSERLKKQYEDSDPTQTITYQGNPYRVEIHKSQNNRNRVNLSEDDKIISVYSNEGGNDAALHALSEWLRRKARQELLPQVLSLSKKTGIPVKKLYIRNQKSRWGSSSSRGNISLNFRLVMAPLFVQQYLVIHELCHQKNFNHSKNFWHEVSRYHPDYRTAEQWLKKNSFLLSLFR